MATIDAESGAGGPGASAGAPASVSTTSREAGLDDLRRAFKAAIVAARRMRGRETRPHPERLSFAQYGLLFSMLDGACQSARELADHADLSPATVAQMLDGLEAAGLVQRTRSTEDKRVVLTELTARGRELLEQRRAEMEPRWLAVLEEFEDEELHTAAAVLRALAGYFDEID